MAAVGMMVTWSTYDPLSASMSYNVRSRLPETTCVPLTENVAANDQSEWASIRITCLPSATLSTRTPLSAPPKANFLLSAEKLAPKSVS